MSRPIYAVDPNETGVYTYFSTRKKAAKHLADLTDRNLTRLAGRVTGITVNDAEFDPADRKGIRKAIMSDSGLYIDVSIKVDDGFDDHSAVMTTFVLN